MPFFTKKPVRIEAVQFLRVAPVSGDPFFAGDDAPDATWPTWLIDALCKQSWQEGAMWVTPVSIDASDGFNKLHIRTLEGIMAVSPNDWVICGVKGELYPCKPDIFAATYDASEDVGETFLVATVTADTKIIGIEHPTEAPWADVLNAHIALRDRLSERIAEQRKCPVKPGDL